MNTRAPEGQFSILASFVDGWRLSYAHARLFAILSFLPFVVTLLTRVALRLLGTDLALFWLPVIQLPSSFVLGLQIALILRFLVLQEAPILENGVARMQRNRSVINAALVFTAIKYFLAGIPVALMAAGLIDADSGKVKMPDPVLAEKLSPWMPLMLAGFVLFLWSMRWLWLHVPSALGWPSDVFYARLGRWGASLRIFCLFSLCSIVVDMIVLLLRVLIVSVAGDNTGGFAAAFDDGVIALGHIGFSILFTACTAAAVRSLSRSRGTWA